MNFKYNMRIFAGHQIIQKKMTADEANNISQKLSSNPDGWLDVTDNEGREHKVRYSSITGIEKTIPVQPKKKDYITIKQLADFFSIKPITVTRNIESLKDLSSANSERPNRRATRKAALELRNYLLSSDFHKSEVPSEEDVLALFAEPSGRRSGKGRTRKPVKKYA